MQEFHLRMSEKIKILQNDKTDRMTLKVMNFTYYVIKYITMIHPVRMRTTKVSEIKACFCINNGHDDDDSHTLNITQNISVKENAYIELKGCHI